MLTKMMKVVSIAALLLAAFFWSCAPNFGLALRFIVGLGACMVAAQALRDKRTAWTLGFFAIAFLFNPFVPVMPTYGTAALLIVLATSAAFAVSLTALKTQPLLSIPSITDRTPGSESL